MLVAILISPLRGVVVYGVLQAESLDCDCREPARRGDAAGNQGCGSETDWTHGLLPTCDSLIAMGVGEGGEKVAAEIAKGPGLKPLRN
jgi:hypothetical protein